MLRTVFCLHITVDALVLMYIHIYNLSYPVEIQSFTISDSFLFFLVQSLSLVLP